MASIRRPLLIRGLLAGDYYQRQPTPNLQRFKRLTYGKLRLLLVNSTRYIFLASGNWVHSRENWSWLES